MSGPLHRAWVGLSWMVAAVAVLCVLWQTACLWAPQYGIALGHECSHTRGVRVAQASDGHGSVTAAQREAAAQAEKTRAATVAKAQAAEVAKNWQLKGVVLRKGQQGWALMQRVGQPARWYQRGQSLRPGLRLVAVQAQAVVLAVLHHRVTLSMPLSRSMDGV